MKVDWSPLQTALARLRADGVALPIWWRDDDAIAVTPALERLHELAQKLGLPAHLAVIPKLAEADLARYVRTSALLVPLVHGWQHQNHAPEGAKKAEFNHPRAHAEKELYDALSVSQSLFGGDLLPVFVPPWNRVSKVLVDKLEGFGYQALSTYGAREMNGKNNALTHINTHIDPIDWRGTRGLVDPDRIIAKLVNTVEARRTGAQDPTEPLGLLTHHLVHDDAIWSFCHALLQELLDAGATPCHLGQVLEEHT